MLAFDRRPKINTRACIILLSGPSVARFADHAKGLDLSGVAFFAINRKAHIEQELAKIGRHVDHWCIFGDSEVAAQAAEIEAFMRDPSRGLFITQSKAGLPSMRKDRTVFADEIHEGLYEWFCAATGEPREAQINSLFVLLHQLIATTRLRTIVLFGCDGPPSMGPVYFRQDDFYDAERLTRSRIAADMDVFHRAWNRSLIEFQHKPVPLILNANPNSCYECFAKTEPDEALRMIASTHFARRLFEPLLKRFSTAGLLF